MNTDLVTTAGVQLTGCSSVHPLPATSSREPVPMQDEDEMAELRPNIHVGTAL